VSYLPDASVERSRSVVFDYEFDEIDKAFLTERLRTPIDAVRQEQILERVNSIVGASKPAGFAFDAARESAQQRIVHVPAEAIDRPVFFVGDIHGDLLAVETVLHYLLLQAEHGEAPIAVFLGDYIDDGPNSADVCLRILERAMLDPASTCLLPGNHDLALQLDGSRFRSDVSPSDFSDWLNDQPAASPSQRLGALLPGFFQRLPRVLFFPNGLFAAHGGFPHTDLLEQIRSKDDLESESCLQDFVWTRAHPRARRKLPNRTSKGCQFGWEDFDRFCEVASTALGRPVQTMVRGHDHVDGGWSDYPAYPRPALTTVNALSHRLGREVGDEYVKPVCLVRYRLGEPIQVHRLHLEDGFVREFCPEPLG
jgi:hypothetical protein